MPVAARIEGEAEARREVVPVAIVKRVEALPDANQSGGRNEIRDAVGFLGQRAGVLVPQAEIQSEPAGDSPIVLQEQADIVGVGVAARGAAGDAGAGGRGHAGQQVGQVIEAQPSARELIVERADQRPAVIHAGLDGVAAARPDQRVDDLIGLADAPARLIGGRAQALESAHHDGRQAAFGSGDQADAGRVETRNPAARRPARSG